MPDPQAHQALRDIIRGVLHYTVTMIICFINIPIHSAFRGRCQSCIFSSRACGHCLVLLALAPCYVCSPVSFGQLVSLVSLILPFRIISPFRHMCGAYPAFHALGSVILVHHVAGRNTLDVVCISMDLRTPGLGDVEKDL